MAVSVRISRLFEQVRYPTWEEVRCTRVRFCANWRRAGWSSSQAPATSYRRRRSATAATSSWPTASPAADHLHRRQRLDPRARSRRDCDSERDADRHRRRGSGSVAEGHSLSDRGRAGARLSRSPHMCNLGDHFVAGCRRCGPGGDADRGLSFRSHSLPGGVFHSG